MIRSKSGEKLVMLIRLKCMSWVESVGTGHAFTQRLIWRSGEMEKVYVPSGDYREVLPHWVR